jgi:hypothetical protein
MLREDSFDGVLERLAALFSTLSFHGYEHLVDKFLELAQCIVRCHPKNDKEYGDESINYE